MDDSQPGGSEIRPQPGPQTAFLESSADIAIYGGAAGGGKSYALLLEGARHSGVPDYGGVIFRRTSPELQGAGSLWDEAQRLYRGTRASMRESPTMLVRWPSGAQLQMLHLQHESDVYAHQGKQYAFCLAEGEPVLLANGTAVPIEALVAGDVVATMDGDAQITNTHDVGKRHCLRVSGDGWSTVVGFGHRVLIGSGWVCLSDLIPTEYHADAGSRSTCQPTHRETWRLDACQHWRSLGVLLCELGLASSLCLETSAWSAGGHSYYAAFDDGLRAAWPHLGLFVPVTLCEPLPRSVGALPSFAGEACAASAQYGGVGGRHETQAQGSLDGCRYGPRWSDAQSRPGAAIDQGRTPSPSDAEERTLCAGSAGDLSPALEYNQSESFAYCHPYSSEVRVAARPVRGGFVHILPAGERSCRDLTVCASSHYITPGGMVNANCGFDELTHFTETQFWYLVSRLRSPSSVRPYLRGTCNPDPDSFVRKLIAWWIGPDGYAIPERSGVLRWFVRDGDAMVWADTREELAGRGVEPMSLTFIAASLDDNPALLARDPAYRARLQSLPQVERERLLGGNWDIRAMGGDYIRADWLTRRWSSRAQLPPLSLYIASDYAVTAAVGGRDPDWTEHGVFGAAPDDTLYVVDWWRGRTTPDVWIDRLLDLIERHKPISVFGEGGTIRRSIEPFLVKRMRERRIYARLEWLSSSVGHGGGARTLQGYEDASKRAKAIRGRALQARAAMGKLCLPDDGIAEWVPQVVSQLVAFPTGHDDAFDAASLMCLAIDQAHPALAPAVVKTEPPRDYGHGERRERRAADWRTV